MRLIGFVAVSWAAIAAAQPLATPAPDTGKPLDGSLPAIPRFDLPVDEPGFVSVQTLRVNKNAHLDSTVKVKGYVTWAYDCATDVAKPGETKAQTQKRIEEDPTQCERRKFYLGASPKEPPFDGLWVVDVPRPPNKLEKERLPKEELKAWPTVPQVKVGAFVVVTGKFTLASKHGERNSSGLVVFESIAPAKPVAVKTAPPPPAPRPTVPAIEKSAAKPADVTHASMKLSNEGTRAYSAKQFATAIERYKQAIATSPGNHVAWYGLAGAYIGQKDWSNARDAASKAAELMPDEPMYQLVYGYTLYEGAIAAEREAQARAQGKKPEEITVDASRINHEKALAHLSHAVRVQPELWRAHYYIGRIHRDAGQARWAAESFSAALQRGPNDPGPWVALVELYRRWRYTDEAIAVATAGMKAAPDAVLPFVLGLAYYDKGKKQDAIAAFDKALERDANESRALFMRGQVYFELRDFARAKADLEAYLQGNSQTFEKQLANRMLLDIAAKKK